MGVIFSILLTLIALSSWVCLGLAMGILAKGAIPDPVRGEIGATYSVALVGAFIGGFLTNLIFSGSLFDFSFFSFIAAPLFAFIFAFLYRTFFKQPRSESQEEV